MIRLFPSLRSILTDLYLGGRFFYLLGGVAVISALGFWLSPLFWVAVGGLLILFLAVLYDGYLLHRAAPAVTAIRRPPRVLSLGDPLNVALEIHNGAKMPLHLLIIDEWPQQLQLRDHRLSTVAEAGERRTLTYPVRPTSRGLYRFGCINLFLRSGWGLAVWRRRIPQEQEVTVYPSLVQMQKFTFPVTRPVESGKRRRPLPVTRSYEFDQIKSYVPGDDRRTVNWKATARRGSLMVNTYTTERAQAIYCLLDKGRSMLMPFDGLSLLDHAINASLALTNLILRRGDRAGLLTFSDKLGDFLAAENRPDQLRRALKLLYRQRERTGESDYDLLLRAVRRLVPVRSMIVLFANFESNYALDRVMPVLRKLGRDHSLVVVLFENTEVASLLDAPTSDAASVYRKATARRYLQERELMALRMRRHGIQVVLTQPADLTGTVIRQYLELKGRGL
ncbi:DUF58 domain-containing protein [Neolewinella litorea]|uniref:DUF58 domain-containing protein n=1 Tax=Neolewinella litorea TaxID=2562452 RepID=A0A4S4NAI8_9BACT|nr:DUF58 domain-containing protein [Neolewinella litorea]THH36344.1 DUF58 domain-containing protein [Neolewinella litorea]